MPGIVFTRAWEDDRLDAELLAVVPGQRSLVIAGAGDAALALAAGGGEVIAVDTNPHQLRLAALKVAGVRVLPPDRLHAWFEAGRDPAIRTEYRSAVRPLLDAVDAAWWDQHIRYFDRGLHRSIGLAPRFIFLGRVARALRRDLARRVETFANPAEQLAWWRKTLRPWVFGRASHWLIAHGPVLGALSPNRNESDRVRRGRWSYGLATRIDGVLGRALVCEHPWWRPLASGRPAGVGFGAAWLDPDRVSALAGNADRIRWVQGDVIGALDREPARSLDAISVSNVPDWLDDAAQATLAAAVGRAAAPGARILVRRLVRPAGSDPYLAAGLVRDSDAGDLSAQDRTALYESVELYRAP